MNPFAKLRVFHWLIAGTALAAYLVESSTIHPWLGYAFIAAFLARILWGAFGRKSVGFRQWVPKAVGSTESERFHSKLGKYLLIGILLSATGTAVTGVLMDRGGTLLSVVPEARADDDRRSDRNKDGDWEGESEKEEALAEVHETLANLFLLFAGAHATHLLLFRRRSAMMMLTGKSGRPGA